MVDLNWEKKEAKNWKMDRDYVVLRTKRKIKRNVRYHQAQECTYNEVPERKEREKKKKIFSKQ